MCFDTFVILVVMADVALGGSVLLAWDFALFVLASWKMRRSCIVKRTTSVGFTLFCSVIITVI